MKHPLIHPKFYKQIFLELFHFIKEPQLNINHNKSVKRKVQETIGLFFIKITFSITIALLLSLFYSPENITDSNMAERFTPLLFVLVGGFILPTYEEITFRLSLKYKAIYASLSLAAIIYYFATKVVCKSNLSLVDSSFTARIVISFIVGLISYLFLYKFKLDTKLELFWKKNFQYIYYLSCVLFAWLHIFNFELTALNILLLPIITLPQLFSATIAGYTRVQFGFQYPLVIHMLTNTIFISLTFLPFD